MASVKKNKKCDSSWTSWPWERTKVIRSLEISVIFYQSPRYNILEDSNHRRLTCHHFITHSFMRIDESTCSTKVLTYSMVHNPSWEANWFAASQQIPGISRNPKVNYRTHKRPPPVSILGQPNPVHIPTSHLLEIHPNITHPSTPSTPQWSPSLRFPHQDPIHPPPIKLLHEYRALHVDTGVHFWSYLSEFVEKEKFFRQKLERKWKYAFYVEKFPST